MNDRKQHVIEMAHQLFIDKGFQATSIQDILDYSGISKGTFYNYFSSKNELLIALFKLIYKKMEKNRNELLIGQNPSNIDIFIKQIELQLKTNRTNKLISLFEEVFFSNDPELKQFIKQGQLRTLRWLFQRFTDIFDDSKKPYLLDCAIMFMGILQQNLKYHELAHGSNHSVHQVVRYSVERIVRMVDEVAKSGDQLVQPELLENLLPDCRNTDQAFQQELYHTVLVLKKALNHREAQTKYMELLEFIQDELLHSKNPRKFLIESALLSFKTGQAAFAKKDVQKLDQLVESFFHQIEELG
ncbi:TetR/AcrR family transcriptional regulator [Bacillus canaveralius]|uniref:TetR/AcrR family transcriptional regulator n=2 Tax=Bacillus canaveralius TaxID=1403243 RepID=A0A2N5GGH5_9BACI|nr:TetR/AcrR family transcriptional regulator [Bacillus canaveralius]PLR79843.1 TetR/AcrR family transcriptional regulator [Bacillus canaveralius]PLR97808.1 TetR/AcrR family transcriptional regulator [Bacillus canaveralius]RSK45553.1 TetR/AcrR family transcriptional regulator [Bacillus canaveralius]